MMTFWYQWELCPNRPPFYFNYRLFPHNWMHLCLENHSKNLVALWQGQYKGLDEGQENYCIPDNIWERIGQETTMTGSTIPTSFGHHTPNVWTEKHSSLLKIGPSG